MLVFRETAALQLRECIHDIRLYDSSSTTARCASAPQWRQVTGKWPG
jgi:hypothetical protein